MQKNILQEFEEFAIFLLNFPIKFKLFIARCTLQRRRGMIMEEAMVTMMTLEKFVFKSMIDLNPPTSPRIQIVNAVSLNWSIYFVTIDNTLLKRDKNCARCSFSLNLLIIEEMHLLLIILVSSKEIIFAMIPGNFASMMFCTTIGWSFLWKQKNIFASLFVVPIPPWILTSRS